MTQAATLAQLASSGALSADTSGNVGVGTTTPSYKLQVSGGTGNGIAYSDGTVINYLGTTGSNIAYSGTLTNHPLVFLVNAAERMRINEIGALLIGTTGFGGVGISLSSPSVSGYYSTAAVTTSIFHLRFANPNGAVGSITTTASATAYATSSDYRLKENVQPMVGALDKISQLKPCTYTWKSDGSNGEGFIAHELQSVIPNAVIGEKDAVDADGNPNYQGVDTSFLVATLTAALQELKAELDVCKAEIAALKGV